MSDDGSPAATDAKALNRPWVVWGSVGVVGLAVVAALIAFLILPASDDQGVSGALGAAGEHETEWMATVENVPPPTEVAWTQTTLRLLDNADADAGQAVAAQCAGCHGQDGIATSAAFPNLAGEPAPAIYKQLMDFAGGYRPSPIMAGIAAGLTEQQMADLARYYASQQGPSFAAGDVASEIVRLTTHGDTARGLPACDSCHLLEGGPTGTPVLRSQPIAYLTTQLQDFATGARSNDIYSLMRTIAQMLTPDEISQLANYYGQ